MTFASLEDMKFALELLFSGLAILGLYCLALGIIGLAMMGFTALMQGNPKMNLIERLHRMDRDKIKRDRARDGIGPIGG